MVSLQEFHLLELAAEFYIIASAAHGRTERTELDIKLSLKL